MPSFFIDRPIFAWVVALFICLVGAIAIPLLAVAQYPIIAPPSIAISTSYPGASPDLMQGFITTPIEQAVAAAEGVDYITSSSVRAPTASTPTSRPSARIHATSASVSFCAHS